MRYNGHEKLGVTYNEIIKENKVVFLFCKMLQYIKSDSTELVKSQYFKNYKTYK